MSKRRHKFKAGQYWHVRTDDASVRALAAIHCPIHPGAKVRITAVKTSSWSNVNAFWMAGVGWERDSWMVPKKCLQKEKPKS